MDDRQPGGTRVVRIVLESAPHPTGWIAPDPNPPAAADMAGAVSFSGWLGLMAELRALLDRRTGDDTWRDER